MKPKIDIAQIYAAALAVFAEFGFRKTTLDDIASRLGMTKSNLYLYAKNKRDLYEATVSYYLVQWQAQVLEQVEMQGDSRTRFLTMCRSAVTYLSVNDDMRNVLRRDPGIFPLFTASDPYEKINDRSREIIETLVRQGIDDGGFRPVSTERVSRAIFLIYKLFIIGTYIQTEDDSINEMYEVILDLLTEGLFSGKEDSVDKIQ